MPAFAKKRVSRSSSGIIRILLLATSVLLAATGCMNVGPGPRSYSVAVLGDIHYTPAWATNNYSRAYKEMWKELSPNMLAASAETVGRDTAFALQLGDIVDVSSTQVLAEAASVLDRTYGSLPIVAVCGNHDVGRGYFAKYMVPWQSAHMGNLSTNEIKTTTFGFRTGPDLWIVIDFGAGERSVGMVEKILADNPDVRYTFVAIHGPVLPMDVWRLRWFYLGYEGVNAARRKMRAMLAKRNAIVFSAHVHALEYKDWYGDGGRITEMVLNSVTCEAGKGPKPGEPVVISETPDDYGAFLKNAEKNDANLKFDALFEEYRPGLKARYAARAGGHHVLRVSDSGVVLEYYGLDSREPTKTFTLR